MDQNPAYEVNEQQNPAVDQNPAYGVNEQQNPAVDQNPAYGVNEQQSPAVDQNPAYGVNKQQSPAVDQNPAYGMTDQQSDYYENEADYYTSVDNKPIPFTGYQRPSSAQSSPGASPVTPPSHKCGLTITTVLLSVTMVVSLAALAVGIAALVTGAQESGEVERRLTESMKETEELRNLVERLAATLNGTSSNVSVLSQELNSLNITSAVESAIAERITSDGTIIGLNFSAVLMNFELYTDCQTSIERQCSISTIASQCETPQLFYINTDQALNYTRDFRCLRMSGSTDQHILATSLTINEAVNEVYCLCYRVMVEGISAVQEVSCGLQVTRCRSSRDVPIDVVTTSPASQP